jgi:hypothetical protein
VELQLQRDLFDWLGFGFNVLASIAGIVGLFVAIQAYKAAHRANRIALEARQDAERLAKEQALESERLIKEQGRKAFDLEVLRELGQTLDRLYLDAWLMDSMDFRVGITTKLLLLSTMVEIPTWMDVAQSGWADRSQVASVREQMHKELLEAIKARTS